MLIPVNIEVEEALYGKAVPLAVDVDADIDLQDIPDLLLAPRLKRINRTKNDFFYYESRKIGARVDCFDRFQDWSDVQNEIRTVLIKPIVALNLAAKKQIDADSTILFLVVDLITFASEDDILNTLGHGIKDFVASALYVIYAALLLLDAVLDLVLRTVITGVEASADLGFYALLSFVNSVVDLLPNFNSPEPPTNGQPQP